jgi:hypothetical protein
MKQSTTTLPGVIAVLSLCGALACGDDEGSSGSGVSGDKLVSDVTDAEAKKVCEWIEDQSASIEPSKKQLCTAVAVGLSSTQAECNEFVDTCLMSDAEIEEEEDEGDGCEDADASEVDFCDKVTVGEFEACVKAYLNTFKQQFAALSCADAGEESEIDDVDPPAACKKIQEECPGLLEGIGGGEEGEAGI